MSEDRRTRGARMRRTAANSALQRCCSADMPNVPKFSEQRHWDRAFREFKLAKIIAVI